MNDFRNLQNALDKIGQEYVNSLKEELRLAGKDNTGELINSISYEVVNTARGYEIIIKAADYLNFVDQGRRPGKQPPTRDIVKWAQQKGIKFKGSTPEQTGYVIARSIGKKGIKPTNVIQKAKDDVIRQQEQYIQDALNLDIQELLNDILK